jgi:hypothetical protein
VIAAAIITAVAIALVSGLRSKSAGNRFLDPAAPPSATAPLKPRTFVRVYAAGAPESYAGSEPSPRLPGSGQ